MLKGVKVGFVILAFAVLLTLHFYTFLPGRIAIHWNAEGVPDGYASKEAGLMLIPLILLMVLLLFEAIPRIDPLSKNIKKFMNFYDGFVIAFAIFMAFVQVLLLLYNAGYAFNMGSLIIGALGIFLVYIGIVLPHLRRNWFIGIRTPWTLSSEAVWEKTHKLGGKLFICAGIISLLFSVFFSKAVVVLVILLIAISVILITYSYLLWRKERK